MSDEYLGFPILQVERKNPSRCIHGLPEYASLCLPTPDCKIFLSHMDTNLSSHPVHPRSDCLAVQCDQVRQRKGTSLTHNGGLCYGRVRPVKSSKQLFTCSGGIQGLEVNGQEKVSWTGCVLIHGGILKQHVD